MVNLPSAYTTLV